MAENSVSGSTRLSQQETIITSGFGFSTASFS
jgi:hypothetical protein